MLLQVIAGEPYRLLRQPKHLSVHLRDASRRRSSARYSRILIIQNDAGNWEAEAANMAQLYSQAFVTIAACAASEGSKGLSPKDSGWPLDKLRSTTQSHQTRPVFIGLPACTNFRASPWHLSVPEPGLYRNVYCLLALTYPVNRWQANLKVKSHKRIFSCIDMLPRVSVLASESLLITVDMLSVLG